MRAPAQKALLNVVIATGFGVLLLIGIYNSYQIRKQNDTIIEQTDINQRFFRCLILIPPGDFKTPTARIKAVDKCAVESKLPSGKSPEPAPTTEDRERFEEEQDPKAEAERPNQSVSRSSTQKTKPKPKPDPEEPDNPSPPTVQQLLDEANKQLACLTSIRGCVL